MGKQRRHLKLVKSRRRRCTLLELVQRVQDSGRGDEDVVATLARLIETGRVVLSGKLAGASFGPEETRGTEATPNDAAAVSGATIRFAR